MPQPRPNKRWYWLLTLPYIAIFWLPYYNRLEPTLFGMPFFYWYQLLWVVLSSAIIALVFRLAHGAGKRGDKS